LGLCLIQRGPDQGNRVLLREKRREVAREEGGGDGQASASYC
jgi:hypothetical protein